MSKLLNELKKNKYTTIVFCLFLGGFIIMWLVYGMVIPGVGTANYGNRLDDIVCKEKDTSKNNEIDCKYNSELKNQTTSIKSTLENSDLVLDADVFVKGKILNVIITVKEDAKVKEVKELSKEITNVLTQTQLKHYDIQFFVKNTKEDTKGYPFIGYKNASAKKFSYGS